MAVPEKLRQERLLIGGAGGHAKVAADCAAATGRWSEIILFDDRWPELTRAAAWPIAGTFSALFSHVLPGDFVFAGVGNNQLRMEWLEKFSANGLNIATIVHPRATVGTNVEIGGGALLVAGVVVNVATVIGMGAIINTSASVDHDCSIGDGVHICPGAHLGGNVRVGRLAHVGIGSSVRHGISIGAEAQVGAGAAVVSDVPACTMVVGVPARQRHVES